jgi:hypothetical protein
LAAGSIVTTAWAIRLSNPSVSTDRSSRQGAIKHLGVADAASTWWMGLQPSPRTSPVRTRRNLPAPLASVQFRRSEVEPLACGTCRGASAAGSLGSSACFCGLVNSAQRSAAARRARRIDQRFRPADWRHEPKHSGFALAPSSQARSKSGSPFP